MRVSEFLFAAALATSVVTAATLPANFTETTVASGIANATAMALAPDGRIFVCQQTGELRVIKNGALLPTPFVTLAVNSLGERGLLGVAFDPAFAANQRVYVYYTTASAPIHNRISRFTANGDVAAAGETVILDLDNLSAATNHNGGAIHFGPDGKLYAGVGENANASNAQTLGNLLGKILRLNADGSIPTDNPFFAQATGNNRAIWALGLRNPFTFAFQPGTGRMFINDVGQVTTEEINDGTAGANYGWPASEGPTTTPGHTGPIHFYAHGSTPTTGCAITGGAFYNPTTQRFPSDYPGDYFFADLCTGWIRRYDPVSNTATGFAAGITAPVDLIVEPAGTLLYLERGANAVKRVDFLPAIQVLGPPPNQTINVTGVTFSWTEIPSASGYDLTIESGTATIFRGTLTGAQSTSALVSLPAGNHTFRVSCLSTACGSASVNFTVAPAAPTQAPSIAFPSNGANLTASTQTLRWSAVASALYYEVQVDVAPSNAPELRIAGPAAETTFSFRAGTFRMRVRACQAGCGPWSADVQFTVTLPAVPTVAPSNIACGTVVTNRLSCTWSPVAGADLYVLQAVQNGTGPGGGALTVASYRGDVAGVTNLPVPQHPGNQATFVIVAACNGNGCGPFSTDSAANGTRQVIPGPNPIGPFLGTPIPGSIVAGPVVQFSWNRISGDSGANTYRLFALDFSRQATALDILTKQNFYGAYFRAEGSRYDALVFAAPPNGNPGNAAPFNVSGTSPTAPTMAVPRHQDTGVTDTIPAGNVLLGWTPVPGATLYEYYVGVPGSSSPTVRGVTPGLTVQVPLAPNLYDGIVRACPAGSTCTFNSDAGWGPWSNLAGPGVTKFRVQ